MKRSIQILDCTLRDGGLALKDAEKNDEECMHFESEEIKTIIGNLKDSSIDIIELGIVEPSVGDKKKYSIYPSIEDISKNMPNNKEKNQKYAMFFTGPDIPLELIPYWDDSLCELVRMSIRYSEMQSSLDYCKKIAKKGYLVSIQPTVTMRYTQKELETVIDVANDLNAFALYFVDSYGCMDYEDIKRIYQLYDEKLNKSIKIGFHAHNNLNLAMANVIEFINQGTQREIIIDSCCMGMGQGAGNLQTEVITSFLNEKYGGKYEFISILKVCEMIEHYWSNNAWGYSVQTMIPAVYKTAYKYGKVLHDIYGIPFTDIAFILQDIPMEMRYRYTQQNVDFLLKGYVKNESF